MLSGRAVVVQRLKPLPIEAVVRGYLIGSGWKDYQQDRRGLRHRAAARASSRPAKLPQPIFTPATKAAVGRARREHLLRRGDANLVGAAARRARCASTSLALYDVRGRIRARARHHHRRHQVRVRRSTSAASCVLIDEVLTPDSSRFWPADTYRKARARPRFDKQFVRDYLETLDWNKTAARAEAAGRRHREDAREVPRSASAVLIGRVKGTHFRRPRIGVRPCSRPARDRARGSRASPSVSAAGPGCRMIGDLISCSSPSRTAGTRVPAGARGHVLGPEFLAAPRADDDVRRARARTSSGSAMMRSRPSGSRAQLGKAVVAAGDADQLARPSGCARDLRLVPFLEVDARPARQAARRSRARSSTRARSSSASAARLGRRSRPCRPARAIMPQDAGDAAVVERRAPRCRRATSACGDVGLQVGEAEHQVGLQRRRCGRSSRW